MQYFKNLSVAARTLAVVCALLVIILIFWAGTAVGYKQAEFSYRWDRHYAEVFGGPGSPFASGGPRGMMGGNITNMMYVGTPQGDASSSNGVAGTIVAVNLPSIAVKDPSRAERVILISTNTTIRRMHAVASSTELRVGDVITAIGTPDAEGRILASFVRIMPILK